MRIAIVTDAWWPQTNGVVTTLLNTGRTLQSMRHTVGVVTPGTFLTLPLPTYPSIRIAVWPGRKVDKMLDFYRPDAVHIATEGPLGFAGRRFCTTRGLRFTTSYHTRFPEYLRLRVPVPLKMSYAYLRWFHSAAERTMVATESVREELVTWGFRNLVLWSRGVDTALFRPRDKALLKDQRPISLYLGRVAVEKNIEAFLQLDLPGTKYVVGDGPDLQWLRRRYPDVRFTGFKYGDDLAAHVAAVDVLVFPSRTDTFGLVMLEAMACGVPVAAYPVPGPVDVIENGVTGVVDEDLGAAALKALQLDSEAAREYALRRSWQTSTEKFLEHLFVNARMQPVAA